MIKIIEQFWCCSIKEIIHDYRKATLLIKLCDSDTNKIYNIKFLGVISLLWTMQGYEGKICTDVYPELTSIEICGLSLNTKNKWLKQFPLEYNVAIEIMDRALIINANAMEIEYNIYYLKNDKDIFDIGTKDN